MNEIPEKPKRPASITVICILGSIGALMAVPMVLSPASQQVGAWYPPYLAFSAAIGMACIVGLWMMKEWAAYTYIGFVVINQIVLVTMGVWSIVALLIPLVVIVFIVKHFQKMS
jgi:hypothetical protein